MLTDPLSGHALDLGRHRYRPTAAMSRFVRRRDKTCQFPGCDRDAQRSDVDHIVEYVGQGHGGLTIRVNLQALCRRHHTLKTRKLWRIDHHPDGSQTWTSALGFTHHRPAEQIPLHELEPPDEPTPPEYIDDRLPDDRSVSGGPTIDDPLPEPATITLEEYLTFSDDFERDAFLRADAHYDQWYRDNHDLYLTT